MHGYLSGGVGGRPVVEPLVMGHESAGEVIAVGEYVTTHKIGDRVAGTFCPTGVGERDADDQWNLDYLAGDVSIAKKVEAISAKVSPVVPHKDEADRQMSGIAVHLDPWVPSPSQCFVSEVEGN
jgi:D-xylulose reductase